MQSLKIRKVVLDAMLSKASSALATNDQVPILRHFLFQIDDKILQVIATDTELSVIAHTELAEVDEPVRMVLPGKTLLEIVKEASDDIPLEFRIKDNEVKIVAGATIWNITTLNSSEYPKLPEFGSIDWIELDRKSFYTALKKVVGAISTDTVRAALMLADISGGKIRASDGFRFHQVDIACPIDIAIPVGAVDLLVKLLRSGEAVDTVGIGQTQNHLMFSVGGDNFICSKAVAEFPDVDNLLLAPALRNDKVMTVDKWAFVQAIRRVRIMADPDTSQLMLNLSENQLEMKAVDKMGNWATQMLDCFWIEEPREVIVNWHHLLDVAEAVDANLLEMRLGEDTQGRKSSLLIKDGTFIAVLSQMRMIEAEAVQKAQKRLQKQKEDSSVQPEVGEVNVDAD